MAFHRATTSLIVHFQFVRCTRPWQPDKTGQEIRQCNVRVGIDGFGGIFRQHCYQLKQRKHFVSSIGGTGILSMENSIANQSEYSNIPVKKEKNTFCQYCTIGVQAY